MKSCKYYFDTEAKQNYDHVHAIYDHESCLTRRQRRQTHNLRVERTATSIVNNLLFWRFTCLHGLTENDGHEIDGHEIDGPSVQA